MRTALLTGDGPYVFEMTVDYDLAIKCWLHKVSLDMDEEVEDLLEQLNAFNEKIVHSEVADGLTDVASERLAISVVVTRKKKAATKTIFNVVKGIFHSK
jgi:uncharacterized protein YwgA